jgi:hypothetical protein
MQWALGPVVGIALYEEKPSRLRSLILCLTFTLIGFSSPFTLIAVPLLAWKAFSERSTYALALLGLAGAAGLLHLHDLLGRALQPSAGSNFLLKIESFLAITYRWLTGPTDPNLFLAILVSVATVCGSTWYLWANREVSKRALVYFFAYGLLLLAVSCYAEPSENMLNPFGYSGRYFYTPTVLILWTFILTEQNSSRWRLTFPIAAVFLCVLYVLNIKPYAPHFRDVDWQRTAECLRTEQTCMTQMNPPGLPDRSIPTDHQLRHSSRDEMRDLAASTILAFHKENIAKRKTVPR